MKMDKLIWIDLEMTGLSPESDVILEIASVVTDSDLKVIEEGPNMIIGQPELALNNMVQVVVDMHESSGLTQAVKASKVTIEEAERETLEFWKSHCGFKKSPLCGNSVWWDRMFLRRYMPKLDKFLHYRNIDVSSIKELAKRWYGADVVDSLPKKKAHRALDDILESVEELKFFRERFFVKS